jgi:hypothetical protein
VATQTQARALARTEPREPLFGRGLVSGLVLALPCWLTLGLVAYLAVRSL